MSREYVKIVAVSGRQTKGDRDRLLERAAKAARALEGKTITYKPPSGVELDGGDFLRRMPYLGFPPPPLIATLNGRPLRRLDRTQLLREVDRIDWPWPTFAVSKRPFDWAEDFADLPAPPRQLLGDRRQWSIPLRPPAPVVQP